MARKFKKTRIKRRVRKRKNCFFCKQKLKPDYKEVETLRHYVSDRGKIIGRAETGVCQKHQRDLALSIKQARFISFLPFIVRPS